MILGKQKLIKEHKKQVFNGVKRRKMGTSVRILSEFMMYLIPFCTAFYGKQKQDIAF
jgi:hypothetical protein